MSTRVAEAKKVATPQHIRWHTLPKEQMNSMLERQYVSGVKTMIARVTMKKGCTIPEHSHANEQIAYIESGTMQFGIAGKEIVVRAGETLLIPPDVPHSATALEDAVGFDFFAPPRQDWIDRDDSYLRG